jgi:hypothetical protein
VQPIAIASIAIQLTPPEYQYRPVLVDVQVRELMLRRRIQTSASTIPHSTMKTRLPKVAT